jgi:hypothetical protein
MTATPIKLKNGSWGAKVQGSVDVGAQLDVQTKSGKTWTATVERVVWSGSGVTIVATRSSRSSRWGQGSGREDCRRYGWDGVVGSSSYYTSGQYDEDS